MTEPNPPTLTGVGTSIVRTVVPYLWGLVVSWAVSVGLPADLARTLEPVSALLVITAGSAIYALARWMERSPQVPRWLSTPLLGSSRAPVYLRATTVSSRRLTAAEADEAGRLWLEQEARRAVDEPRGQRP